MRKNFGVKTYVYPQPVFILAAYDAAGNACAMNAAWGGICSRNQLSFCVSAGHKTVKDLRAQGAFTVSMGTASQATACDYVGMESGNEVPNKMEKAGFPTEKAEFVNAPVIAELPLCIECKLVSYDEATGRLVGEIVNVNAEESILDAEGLIDPAKLEPIVYDSVHHDYLVIGKKVGNAFEDGAKLK